MPSLSDEELACFSDLFAPKSVSELQNGEAALNKGPFSDHFLSVSTEVPQVLANILGQAKLTLLAEISHYRLWFPLDLKLDELGQFVPVLGVPEVLDTRGAERSWRVTNLKDVKVFDNQTNQPVEVLSLSSSGLTIKVPDYIEADRSRLATLCLPNGLEVEVEFEPVRTENGVMAAKINTQGEARDTLRQFLFSEHKAKYSHLYESSKSLALS